MLLIILTILFTFLYFYVKKSLSYWENKGIPNEKQSFFSSYFSKKPDTERVCERYHKFENKRYYGIYSLIRPVLVIRDPDLIKKIAIKWFDAFANHRGFAPKYADPIWAKNAFAINFEDGWHDLRTTLSPTLTSSKLRLMFQLMQRCAEQCVKHYRKQEGLVTVEAKDMFSRYTVDVIGTTTFSIACNSFEQPENEFYMMSKDTADFSGLKAFKFLGYSLVPFIMKLFDIRLFNKKVIQFFGGFMNESIKLRRERRLDRIDLIHLLMQAQKGELKYDDKNDNINPGFSAVEESDLIKKWKKKIDITDEDIMGVGLGFFLAGYDTASNVMSYIAYELAANPDVQEKLFKEVSSISRDSNGKITYEGLHQMKYLDMVASETLRKWPPGYHMDRECRIPFTIEPETEDERPLLVEKGTQCLITVLGIHRDPKYFPNPEKFDPERFNDENRRNIKPYTYMPFGVGPRSCMGSRFALLEMKLVIEELIMAFEIVILDKTELPLNIKKEGFTHYPVGGIWLGLKPRDVSS